MPDAAACISAIGTVVYAMATVALAIIAGVSACSAVKQYGRNAERDKARWLHQLFRRFYCGKAYKRVYLALDELDPPLLTDIEKMIAGSENVDASLEWEFAGYLNFFELVAALGTPRRGVLNDADIRVLFEWPLKRLARLSGLIEYLDRYNYSELTALLKALSPTDER